MPRHKEPNRKGVCRSNGARNSWRLSSEIVNSNSFSCSFSAKSYHGDKPPRLGSDKNNLNKFPSCGGTRRPTMSCYQVKLILRTTQTSARMPLSKACLCLRGFIAYTSRCDIFVMSVARDLASTITTRWFNNSWGR